MLAEVGANSDEFPSPDSAVLFFSPPETLVRRADGSGVVANSGSGLGPATK